MLIGIDGSRAFVKEKTGIEEYSYQVIKNLRGKLKKHQVIVFLRKNQSIDFSLPQNWKVKILSIPRFWTQLGLSWEVFFQKIEILFISAHTVPFFHPEKTVVVVHGLEFETFPEGYSAWEKFYMHLSVKKSCHWAEKIVAVSQNTKKDLERIYKIPPKKIRVIYEGIREEIFSFKEKLEEEKKEHFPKKEKKEKYLFFVGRLEKRKNVFVILDTFEILKEEYKIPHKLFLAGGPGFGYEEIMRKIQNSKFKKDIHILGFINNEKKWSLMANCEIFFWPSFYEGFGLPILEAQALGTPILTSNLSSLPEISGQGACFTDPNEPVAMAKIIQLILQDEEMRKDLLRKGYENIERFSWEKCSQEIAEILSGYEK